MKDNSCQVFHLNADTIFYWNNEKQEVFLVSKKVDEMSDVLQIKKIRFFTGIFVISYIIINMSMHSTHIKKIIIFENYFHGNGFLCHYNVSSIKCRIC